jgi:hypothetical protein
MCSYNRTNNGYNWILVCIAVSSKFVWIKLLKKKAANPVAVAFREIMAENLLIFNAMKVQSSLIQLLRDYLESKILIYTLLRAIKKQVLLKEF